MARIGVLGPGAWGTALAIVLTEAGHETVLWAADDAVAQEIERERRNPRHLPDVRLPPSIRATARLEEALACRTLLLVIPAQAYRLLVPRMKGFGGTAVICSKGLDRASGRRLSQITTEALPDARIAVLSGPSFAAEVAMGRPTAVTVAAEDLATAQGLAATLATRAFRPYPSNDLLGVEFGGAFKNVIAIAAGVVMGRELGENARAGIVTRGLAELIRMGVALGARQETLIGLSGLGDLVLTATSLTSRNTRLGYELGRGGDARDLVGRGRALAEGAFTARAAVDLGARLGVELPIAGAVAAVIDGTMSIDQAIDSLLQRPLRGHE